MLATEPDDAVAVVFDALGTTNRAATVLDDVVVGRARPRAARRPRGAAAAVRGVGSAGRLAGGHLRASGLGVGTRATARELLVVCDAGSGARRGAVPAASVAQRGRSRGVDPEAACTSCEVDHAAAPTT